MKKVRIRYVGTYPIMFRCPGFNGDVNPGEEIEVLAEALIDLDGDDNWEVIKEKKARKNDEGDE